MPRSQEQRAHHCVLVPPLLWAGLLPAPSVSSQGLTLPCLLGSFPLQTSAAVVKVDVVSVGTYLQGPLGKKNIH